MTHMRIPLAEAAPARRGVFPIPPEQMNLTVDVWDHFTPEERMAAADSNLALLAPDTPMRYLLGFEARPGLAEADKPGYTAGVCAATAVLRRHLRALEAEGYHFPEPVFDPAQVPKFRDPKPRLPTAIIMLPLYRQFRRLREIYSTYGRMGDYFAGEESIGVGGLTRSLLSGKVRIDGLPFLSDQQAESGEAPGFWRGAGDTLELHYRLYDRLGVAGERSPASLVLQMEPFPIWRHNKQDAWPAAGLHARQRFSKGADFYRQWHTAAGYVATIEKNGQRLRGDIWWNRHVPAGATLQKVRAFPSHGVLVGTGSGNEHTAKLTSRKWVQSARLGREDLLLVRGADGQILPLGHPFTVPVEWAAEDGMVELVRLCKAGEITDFMDAADLDPAAWAQCDALGEQVLAAQRLGRAARRGRVALTQAVAEDAIISFGMLSWGPLVPGVPNAVGSAGVFSATFAFLRVWRARQERKRAFAAPPSAEQM